jgi:hypothetical protein
MRCIAPLRLNCRVSPSRYRRRFANRGLAHWGLADRSLTHLRLLVLRARQICSLPSEVPVTTRNFNMSILPITRDKT